jgi:hypothetical protein
MNSGEYEYNKLSPEELVNSMEVKISQGSSQSMIGEALKNGYGINFVIDGFEVWLSHNTHGSICYDNGLFEKTTIDGGVYGTFGKLRVVISPTARELKMVKLFGINPIDLNQYIEAIKTKVLNDVEKVNPQK